MTDPNFVKDSILALRRALNQAESAMADLQNAVAKALCPVKVGDIVVLPDEWTAHDVPHAACGDGRHCGKKMAVEWVGPCFYDSGSIWRISGLLFRQDGKIGRLRASIVAPFHSKPGTIEAMIVKSLEPRDAE